MYPPLKGRTTFVHSYSSFNCISLKEWAKSRKIAITDNFFILIKENKKAYDELRQGPGPDLGPRLNGYGDRTIMGTGHYGDRLISGPAIIGTGSLVACNDRSGPENDTPGPETRGAVPKMIPPVPKREERSRFF